jgi:hypothetical protein
MKIHERKWVSRQTGWNEERVQLARHVKNRKEKSIQNIVI